MTAKEILILAKEKLGKDITEQEAQEYLDGKRALPDEALELVDGGAGCVQGQPCPRCGIPMARSMESGKIECNMCGYVEGEPVIVNICPECGDNMNQISNTSLYQCKSCGYIEGPVAAKVRIRGK